MSLWGTNSTNRAKPKWLVSGGQFSPDRCYATNEGWVYKHLNGNVEVLVAIGGLADALGGAQITQVYFSAVNYTVGDVASVTVVFTEPVTLTSGTPTLSVTTVSGTASPVTFTYASGTGTDKFVFNTTLSTATLAGEVLAIAGQTIGGAPVLADAVGSSGTVDTAFVNGDRSGVPDTNSAYANIQMRGATITKAAFTAASFSAAALTLSTKIKFNTPVTVTGSPTVTVNQVTVGSITLTYASGSGTDTLVFTNATSGIQSGKTIQFLAQTIGLTSATITAVAVNADAAFASGDRTASDFVGAYADIVVSA